MVDIVKQLRNDRLTEGCIALCDDAAEEIERLRAALTEIAEGKGRFSNDPFKHACNTIEDMKEIATSALSSQSRGGEA